MSFPLFVTFRYYVRYKTLNVALIVGTALLIHQVLQPHEFPSSSYAAGYLFGSIVVTYGLSCLIIIPGLAFLRTVYRYFREGFLSSSVEGETMSDAECLSAMEHTVNAVPAFADLDADRLRPDQVDEIQKAVHETTGAVMSGREVRVWFSGWKSRR